MLQVVALSDKGTYLICQDDFGRIFNVTSDVPQAIGSFIHKDTSCEMHILEQVSMNIKSMESYFVMKPVQGVGIICTCPAWKYSVNKTCKHCKL